MLLNFDTNKERRTSFRQVMDAIGVQQEFAPNSICFGCGPANDDGLKIQSKRIENGLYLEFMPEKHHQAFPGMINGGIIGTLLDCHGNWTAAIALMDAEQLDEPPCTVTASYSVQLRRPTPTDTLLCITSQIKSISGNKVDVELLMEANGKVCATGSGLFVSVKEGHPAYHRWN
jgi:acyl-coenzyme A thioesterase PaaI-like protein